MILCRVSKQVERKGLATITETACFSCIPRRDGVLRPSTNLWGGIPLKAWKVNYICSEQRQPLWQQIIRDIIAREVSVYFEKMLWGQGSGQDRRL